MGVVPLFVFMLFGNTSWTLCGALVLREGFPREQRGELVGSSLLHSVSYKQARGSAVSTSLSSLTPPARRRVLEAPRDAG